MTTTTTATPLPERASATPASGAAGLVRALGAGSALLVAAHLVIAIMYVPRWPENLALVSWSAVAVPLALLAIGVAMWLTGAASRLLLAVQLVGALAMTVVYVLGAATNDRIFAEDLEMWVSIAALTGQYLAALGVLARGAWRGVQRVLPVLGASWATVVLPVAVAFSDFEATWWPFIVYVCAGLIVNGVALAIRPSGGAEAAR
ncbi:hypothetical protein H4J02_00515 [Protaetiibacter sp. SSC-01]|uniref:hypothetical protein n=1 Tax=Protaetiibacter sp. SSC-01 TaxID=2759943 RepID=UPI00165760EE|nr:hypothetical protein [Protaetiibacter sp. SSC-01]QNO37572.1 hypothetical protein H4J02_00515 [Protaetiibacter sp. SSC-01]